MRVWALKRNDGRQWLFIKPEWKSITAEAGGCFDILRWSWNWFHVVLMANNQGIGLGVSQGESSVALPVENEVWRGVEPWLKFGHAVEITQDDPLTGINLRWSDFGLGVKRFGYLVSVLLVTLAHIPQGVLIGAWNGE